MSTDNFSELKKVFPNLLMRDRYNASSKERAIIEDFWDWLRADAISNGVGEERYPRIHDVHIQKKLDEYHGINREILEIEQSEFIRSHYEKPPIIPIP